MSMRTYDELLAAQTELAHFNKYHDPKTGQFTSGDAGSSIKITNKDRKRMVKNVRENFAKGSTSETRSAIDNDQPFQTKIQSDMEYQKVYKEAIESNKKIQKILKKLDNIPFDELGSDKYYKLTEQLNNEMDRDYELGKKWEKEGRRLVNDYLGKYADKTVATMKRDARKYLSSSFPRKITVGSELTEYLMRYPD